MSLAGFPGLVPLALLMPLAAVLLIAAIVLAIVTVAGSRNPSPETVQSAALRSHARSVAWILGLLGPAGALALATGCMLLFADVGAVSVIGLAILALAALFFYGAIALGESTWPHGTSPIATASLRQPPSWQLASSPDRMAGWGGLVLAVVCAAIAAIDAGLSPAGILGTARFSGTAGLAGDGPAGTSIAVGTIGPAGSWTALIAVLLAAIAIGGLAELGLRRVLARPAIAGIGAGLDWEMRRLTARRITRGLAVAAATLLAAATWAIANAPLAETTSPAVFPASLVDGTMPHEIVTRTPLAWVLIALGILGVVTLAASAIWPTRPAIDFHAGQ